MSFNEHQRIRKPKKMKMIESETRLKSAGDDKANKQACFGKR
jgi:hypothetical protein